MNKDMEITFVSLSTFTPESDCAPFVEVSIHRAGKVRSYYRPTASSIVRIIRVQAKRSLLALRRTA